MQAIDEKLHEVEAALTAVRPAMEADGGGVELVSVDAGTVTVRFVGTCLACPSIGLSFTHGVATTLKREVPWVKEVLRTEE